MNIAQSVCASQGGDSIVDKYISNVGCHAGTVITTTGYSSSTACSPPHVGLVNNSVSGMSVNTTVEGVTTSGVARPRPTRACALPSTFQALPSRASKSHVIL